jgi:hypothetical protein
MADPRVQAVQPSTQQKEMLGRIREVLGPGKPGARRRETAGTR